MTRPSLLLPIAIALLTSCRPKGSYKTPTIEKTSSNNFIVRHPNFEGHLDPKVMRDVVKDRSKFNLQLTYSSFPEKTTITIEGKTLPLGRSGDIPTSFNLSKAIGDAPITTLTGGGPDLAIDLPFELTFWGGRQKLSSSITGVRPWLELRSCMQSPPCAFPDDGPPNAKPNIVLYEKNDVMGQTVFGSPPRVRDVDWIASSATGTEVDGKKCKMRKLSTTTGSAAAYSDEYTLKRESEHINVYDRRTGAKLHERDLLGPDACPIIADIKMAGDKAGLRSAVHRLDREAVFKELRGEAPPAAASSSSTAPPPSQKSKKPGKK